MRGKVLYISYDGMTDPLGQSQVLPYLASLSTQGYQFTILSFEKKSRFEKEKALIEDVAGKTGIIWHPLIYTKSPPILSKIYDRVRLKQTAEKLYLKHNYDMIHCRSYVAAEVGLYLKEKYGVKFLFDMRGFWPDEKVDSGQWDQKNILYRKIYQHYKSKESKFLQNADGIISLTRAAKAELLSRENYDKLELDVIPCCADLDHFNYEHINTQLVEGIREQLGLAPDQKVITYLGSVGGWYMTKEMLDFFKRLLARYPEYVMLVLTKDEPSVIQLQAKEAGIPPEKIITRYAGRNELPDYISLSDCSIFFIRPTYSKIASSPTKHAELMGMGIPVICNNIGDTGAIIEETKTGLVVNEFVNQEYDRIIDQMDQLISIPRKSIRDAAFRYFDLEQGAGEYLKVYRKILHD